MHLLLPLLWLVDDVPAEELSKVFCSTLAGVVRDKAGMQTGDILQIPEAEGIILLVLSERQLSILWWDRMLFIRYARIRGRASECSCHEHSDTHTNHPQEE